MGKEYVRAYRASHPVWWRAAKAAFNANARARRLGHDDRITTGDVLLLWEEQPECPECGGLPGLDHMIPFVLGGRNVIDNLRALCRFCNSAQGGRLSGATKKARRKGLRVKTPKTYLTLSALTGLLPEDARSAAHLQTLLDDGDTEAVIDYVWADSLAALRQDGAA